MKVRSVTTGTSRIVLLLILTVGTSDCIRSRDYTFSVTGYVTSEDGTPLAGADVAIEVYGSVYAGITPVRTEHVQTNQNGSFVFMHLSHQRGVKYTVTVSKPGYESQTASGAAPPDGQHTMRLKPIG